MPQYGAGTSFSKMKRSLEKKKRKKTKKKRHNKTRRHTINTKSKDHACQCGTHRFTGSEPTPRGLGNCEECVPLHVVLRGKDGQLYENRGNTWALL